MHAAAASAAGAGAGPEVEDAGHEIEAEDRDGNEDSGEDGRS